MWVGKSDGAGRLGSVRGAASHLRVRLTLAALLVGEDRRGRRTLLEVERRLPARPTAEVVDTVTMRHARVTEATRRLLARHLGQSQAQG
eukprot:scaffold132673_cov69-Phaeocystis_antarctica.AAC.1